VTLPDWVAEMNDTALREELDRAHPERTELRPTDVRGLQRAFDLVEEMWAPTIERARRLSREALHERVNGEYSFIETFRHLLFAWEAWLRGLLGVPEGYHRWALPPDIPEDAPTPVLFVLGSGWTASDDALDLDAVLEVRGDYLTRVRDFVSGASEEDINGPGTPPPWHPGQLSQLDCLRLILREEWWHHRYAARDLAVLEAS
jgi:hypothetical protein